MRRHARRGVLYLEKEPGVLKVARSTSKAGQLMTESARVAAPLHSGGKAPATWLALQRSHGNRFVQRTLERSAAPDTLAGRPSTPARAQREVTVSPLGGPLEREADAMADKALRTAESTPERDRAGAAPARRAPAFDRGWPSSRQQNGNELRRATAEGGASPALAPPIVHEVLGTAGRQLEPAPRRAMEGRFGADFSSVRVHDDARAAESARVLGAHAYTVGADLVFAAGRYTPGTPKGDRLLAHELAHTLQGGADSLRRQPSDTPLLDVGTGDPASLNRSIDLSDPQRVRTEIAAIRRWLARRSPGPEDAQAKRLREMLPVLEAQVSRAPLLATTVWDAFAPAFNQEFMSVLNGFAVPGFPAGPLTPTQLQALFTDTQRRKLMEFIVTRRIPDRLFNSTDKGTTTAQQRILLSAYILANGTYQPGSFDQRVHAQYCFHWVQIVHHYAGATPPGAGFSGGVMGTFDPKGAAVLTSGKEIDVWHEKYVSKPDLPKDESPNAPDPSDKGTTRDEADGTRPRTGIGPLHEGTRQAEAAEKARKADPTKPSRFRRQPSLPFDDFDTLEAGDWLWYYNANASEGGAHSVIFSHWKTGTNLVHKDTGARYRVAVVWSQPKPDSGGRRHEANLGDRFVPNPSNNLAPFVTPITHVSRVTPDTAPATTAAEMSPAPTAAKASKLAEANEAFIKQKEKKLSAIVNRPKLVKWLRDKNESFVAALGNHLDPRQRDVLMKEVNASDDLQTLVRLYQRLHTLHVNARLLDENTAAHYAKLNPAHQAAKEQKEAALAAAAKEIREVDNEIALEESDVRGGDQKLIDALMAEAASLKREISKLQDGPERDELVILREHRLDQAERLREAPLRKRKLSVRRKKAIGAREKAAAMALPYGRVHPGKLSKEDRHATTGKLADIDVEWVKVVDQSPSAPTAAKPKKP